MTRDQATVVATWKCNLDADDPTIATLARGVWGLATCRDWISDGSAKGGQLGMWLVMRAEEELGLSYGELAHMRFNDVTCDLCGFSHIALSYPSGAPAQCGNCGKMASVPTEASAEH